MVWGGDSSHLSYDTWGKISIVSACTTITVMKWLDLIEELYNLYSEEENSPKIVEVIDDDMDLASDIEGPMDPYLDL